MTPEQRADRIVILLEVDKGDSLDTEWCRDQITAAIREAVAAANAQARTALEPFARLAPIAGKEEYVEIIHIMASELRAARDAYVALGGKIG